MNVAVLSVTRDRVEFTQHCFASLHEHAGCGYGHFVYDNASSDRSVKWLKAHGGLVMEGDENIGICRGLNRLLDLGLPKQYDVIVRFDNDCEVTQPDTLKTVCEVAYEYEAIVAPRVNGLRFPPPTIAETQLGEHVIEETAILGGIFMAIPATLFSEHGYRFDESSPLWAGDEAIVPWWRRRGGTCGYLRGVSVNHYLTSVGQLEWQPEYEARKAQEMAL